MNRVQIKPRTIPYGYGFSKYLNQHETSILVDLVKSVSPKVMIEIGCNNGLTAKRVLENVPSIEKYIGIDVPPDHKPTLDCQLSEIPRDAGICAYDSRFFLLLCPSREIESDDLEWIDAVFIDGDHSYDAVMHESRLAVSLLKPGGIVIWHDYNNPAVEVTRVLDELVEKGWPISSVEGSWLAFMRIPKGD